MFNNVSKEDEGLYEMEESYYRRDRTDTYERKDGTWSFQLNVHEQHEEMQHRVGENITMELRISTIQSTLYFYNQTVALLYGSNCSVLTGSPFYGRQRYTSYESTVRLEVDNVTQRDAGLYKIVTDGSENGRWFLNITDKPTSTFISDNVTIGWYYNQQGMNRTLRIIHPNDGVMMTLQPSNNSTIKSYFQHRMLYSGDISRSYMSLTLLNVSKSDTGVYTIETLHGNSIPGRKKLIVEDIATTSTTSNVKLDILSTEIPRYSPTNIPYGQPMTGRAGNTTTSTQSTIKGYASSTDSQHNSVSLGVPIYVLIPVVTAAVGVIMAMIGFLMWIQRKNSSTLEAVQRLVLEKCETASFATPSTIRRPPPMPAREEEWTRRPAPQTNAVSNAIFGLPYGTIPTAPASLDNAWCSTYSLSELKDDKPSVNFITNLDGSSGRTDEKISVACDEDTDDDILESCPSVCILASAADDDENNYNSISDGNGQRQVSQCIQTLYAQVKKGPTVSSKNTTTFDDFAAAGGTDGLCGDGYEMVDISRHFDSHKTFQNDSTASESPKSQTPSCHGIPGSKNRFVHGPNEDDGYESVETVMNMRSAGNIREEDAMAIRDGKQKEEKKIPGITSNDYADVDS